MKNIANYIDDYIEDDLYECTSRNIKDMKDRMKAFKRGSREEEIEAHGRPISYNKTFRDRSKYTRKNKHKNNINI
jgi:hypothetical protein